MLAQSVLQQLGAKRIGYLFTIFTLAFSCPHFNAVNDAVRNVQWVIGNRTLLPTLNAANHHYGSSVGMNTVLGSPHILQAGYLHSYEINLYLIGGTGS